MESQPAGKWRSVGLWLRQVREAEGLSRRKVALRAQICETHLQGIEAGERSASVRTLRSIAQALGADPEEACALAGR